MGGALSRARVARRLNRIGSEAATVSAAPASPSPSTNTATPTTTLLTRERTCLRTGTTCAARVLLQGLPSSVRAPTGHSLLFFFHADFLPGWLPVVTFFFSSPFMQLAERLAVLRAWCTRLPAWAVKTRRAPSRRCKDARFMGLRLCTPTHEMSTPTPPPPALRFLFPLFRVFFSGGYPYRGQRFSEVLTGALLFADAQKK